MREDLHKFLTWAPAAVGGLLTLAATLGGEPVRQAIWEGILAIYHDRMAFPVAVLFALAWLLAWYLTRSKPAESVSLPVPHRNPANIVDAIVEAKYESNRAAIQESLPPSREDKRGIVSGILYVTFRDWTHTLSDLSPEDQIAFLGGGAKRLEDAASDGDLVIFGRKALHGGRHVPIPKEDWASIQIERLSLFPSHGGPTRTELMGHWMGPIIEYHDLLVRQADLEQLFPAPTQDQIPDIPLTLNSLGAYMRGFPRIRRLAEKIAASLERPISDEHQGASVAYVEQATAFGISTIRQLDEALEREEVLVIRVAAYCIPKKLEMDFCLQCLFFVLGGRMGADAYWEKVKSLRYHSTSLAACREQEQIYRLITAY